MGKQIQYACEEIRGHFLLLKKGNFYKNMAYRKDLLNSVFGRLTVKAFAGQDKHKHNMWECQCVCNNIIITSTTHLTTGHTQSCGCLHRDTCAKYLVDFVKENGPHNKMPAGEAAFKRVYRGIKASAAKRGYVFEISENHFLELSQQRCKYCKKLPSNATKSHDSTGYFVYNGLDRIDNTQGYIIDNVVPCCEKCNKDKGRVTPEIIYISYHLLKEKGLFDAK